MRLASWNVNGIRAVMKKDFTESLSKLNCDVLCLQETKAQDDQVVEALEPVNGYHVFSNSAVRKGYSGTAILSKEKPVNVLPDMGIAEHDEEGRILTAEFDTFYLVNTYVPNSGNNLVRLDYRKKWDADMADYLTDLNKHKPVILCGDLNVCHQAIDIARPEANYNKSAGYTQTEIDGLSEIINRGFTDSWRNAHPDEVKYSWWSYRGGARQKNIGWRLDYFLVNNDLMNKVQDTFIDNDVLGSDHCPVGLTLGL